MSWILSVTALAFVALSAVCGVCLAAFGGLGPGVSAIALGLGFIGALCFSWVLFYRRPNHNVPPLKMGLWTWAVTGCFLIFLARQMLWIFFQRDGNFYSLNVNNYGDLPLHLSYIGYFSRGAPFWPENPLFTGQMLHYPFGMDFFNALFSALGISLERSLPLTGFVLGLALIATLLRWSGGFGLSAFLFSGGLAGVSIFTLQIWRDYQADLAWKSLPLAIYITQRGFLWALPAGLVLLTSWHRRFFSKEALLPFWAEGFFWGVMPLFHLHTFLFLSVLFAVWSLQSRRLRAGLFTLGVALVPATVLVLFLTDFFRAPSLFWIKPGWMAVGQNPFIFFTLNFGFWLPLFIFGLWYTQRKRWMLGRELLYPGAAIFLALFFVMVAPWDWDNTKVMIWAYLLMLPALGALFMKIARPAYRGALGVCLFFTGFISIVSTSSVEMRGVEIFKRSEVEPLCGELRKLKPTDRVATVQTFNHPVALCGQALVAGYAGHLWSHGINATVVEGKLKKLLAGDADWRQLGRDLNARYLFWGERESKEFAQSAQPWASRQKIVAQGTWGVLYDLQEAQ